MLFVHIWVFPEIKVFVFVNAFPFNRHIKGTRSHLCYHKSCFIVSAISTLPYRLSKCVLIKHITKIGHYLFMNIYLAIQRIHKQLSAFSNTCGHSLSGSGSRDNVMGISLTPLKLCSTQHAM